MTITIGITGTRKGANKIQQIAISQKLNDKGVSRFHHGCAVGVDIQAAQFAHTSGIYVVGHPGMDTHGNVRSNITNFDNHTEEPLLFLQRNRIIVDASNLILAVPKNMQEERRSGTWYTVRYCRTVNKPLIILWPDGTETKENL